jgi:hypothetical protein
MPILRARRGAIVGAVAAEKAAATLVGSDRRVGLVVGLLAAAVPVAPAVLGVGVIVGLLDRGRVGLADRAHLVFRGSRALAGASSGGRLARRSGPGTVAGWAPWVWA